MIIKEVKAKIIKDSRRKPTIQVIVITDKGRFITSAPSGKSTGEHEIKSYVKTFKSDKTLKDKLKSDIRFINEISIEKLNKLNLKKFEDLKKLEKLVSNKIGGNSLFAFESSILKSLAKENNKELWEWLNPNPKVSKFPRLVGNAIGGGLHSKGVNRLKPDFQEFLFIANGDTFAESVEINNQAYKLAKKLLKARKRNDEGAWETNHNDEEILEIMSEIRTRLRKKHKRINIGLDVAASSFFKNRKYIYKNPRVEMTENSQVHYIEDLIKKYILFYVEDPLDEEDFSGFKELNKGDCLIVGDDLTTTNPKRLKRAIKMKSINSIIVKPNQIGSLLKVKEVIELSKKNNIKTIISHRSGETMDDTIADLAVAWETNFIKISIYGKVREAKLRRLIEIERSI